MNILLLFLFSLAGFAYDGLDPVTEQSYSETIDKAHAMFSPLVIMTGNKLVIRKTWDTSERSCFATFNQPEYRITLNGAAFRTKVMNNDGLVYTICHEINHIMGGDPKYSPGYWPSIEGQADYMASNTCTRAFFREDDNRALVARMKIPVEVKAACDKVYLDGEESALCQRSAMSGWVFAENYRQFKLLPGEFHRVWPAISFSKKDPTVVRETNRSYTSPQCRFDTALAGALCSKGNNFKLTESLDPNSFVCTNRPKCWIKE